jgi:cytochrome c
MKSIIFGIIIAMLLAGCFTAKTSAEGEKTLETHLQKLKKDYPEYTEMDYKQGKMLYEQTCNTCHGFKDPSRYSAEELKSIVPNMVRKSNQKKGTSLTSLDSDLIYKYMLAISP